MTFRRNLILAAATFAALLGATGRQASAVQMTSNLLMSNTFPDVTSATPYATVTVTAGEGSLADNQVSIRVQIFKVDSIYGTNYLTGNNGFGMDAFYFNSGIDFKSSELSLTSVPTDWSLSIPKKPTNVSEFGRFELVNTSPTGKDAVKTTTDITFTLTDSSGALAALSADDRAANFVQLSTFNNDKEDGTKTKTLSYFAAHVKNFVYTIGSGSKKKTITSHFIATNDFEVVPQSITPEPSTIAMGGLAGVIGLGAAWRRRRAAQA